MTDLPIACSLTPDARRARRDGLLADLLQRAGRSEWSDDGLSLRFAAGADTLAAITRAIDAERRCCRFLHFTLTVEPDEGPMVLQLTGPAGTREFLAALIGV